MKCKFLTKTARTQGQSIKFFTNTFTYVPQSQLGDLLGKLVMNTIITKNEGRDFLGLPPSMDEAADQLANPQLYDQGEAPVAGAGGGEEGQGVDPENPEIEYA
jgi:hypothetical protein